MCSCDWWILFAASAQLRGWRQSIVMYEMEEGRVHTAKWWMNAFASNFHLLNKEWRLQLFYSLSTLAELKMFGWEVRVHFAATQPIINHSRWRIFNKVFQHIFRSTVDGHVPFSKIVNAKNGVINGYVFGLVNYVQLGKIWKLDFSCRVNPFSAMSRRAVLCDHATCRLQNTHVQRAI